MSEKEDKSFGQNRKLEWYFRFVAFVFGCFVTVIIMSLTAMKKMNMAIDNLRGYRVSPPARAVNVSPEELAARDKIESKMKGGVFLEMQRHFESLTPEEQKEIKEGLNDPMVRKMMDQMFKKSAEMFHRIEQQAEQQIEQITETTNE